MKKKTNLHDRPYAIVGILACLITGSAWGHHILGVPHYAYDENYPQTPVLTYRAETRDFVVEMTGYPGKPEPGERFSLHAYIQDAQTGEVMNSNATLTVSRERFLVRDEIIYGPMEAELEESMYKYFPQFEVAGNYMLELSFDAQDERMTILLPMTIGEPKSPWAAIATGGALLGAFLVLTRAALIKRERRNAAALESEPPLPADSVETA